MGNVSNAVIQFLASSKTRVVILGLLVLSTGVFTTIYLVNQRQDIRQRAAWDTGGFCIQNSQCTSGKCEGVQYDQQGNIIGAGTCTTSGITPTPAPTTGGGGTSSACNSCLSQGKQYYCPPSFISRQTTGTCSDTNTGFCTKCQASPTPTQPINSPTPTLTPTPTLSPTPTIDPACAGSTGKQNGCTCNINAHCASGFCSQNGGATGTCQDNTPTSSQLTCDPNRDGVINILDFQWWKDEMFGTRTTKESDCFNPDGVVNILDFQVWKDIAITKIKQPF